MVSLETKNENWNLASELSKETTIWERKKKKINSGSSFSHYCLVLTSKASDDPVEDLVLGLRVCYEINVGVWVTFLGNRNKRLCPINLPSDSNLKTNSYLKINEILN